MFSTLGSFSIFFVIAAAAIALGFIFEERLIKFEDKVADCFRRKCCSAESKDEIGSAVPYRADCSQRSRRSGRAA